MCLLNLAECKAWWAADLASGWVADLVAAFNGTRNDTLGRHSLDAPEQIYGYMTFNNNKLGILTNRQRA